MQQSQLSDEKRSDNDSRARPSVGLGTRAVQTPAVPTFRQKWDAFRPSKTVFIWSLIGMVALTMMVGFFWGGWMTTASAATLADATAKSAIVDRFAPMCVAQFNLDPEKEQKLLALQSGSSYERTKYVTDQGWATLPGETKPTSQVAAACANLLMQTGQ